MTLRGLLLGAVVALTVVTASSARAQDVSERQGTATIDVNTPLFPLPETQGNVILLPPGTQLRVLGRVRSWLKVSVTEQGGAEVIGLIAPGSVTLQAGEPEPSDAGVFSQRGFAEGRMVGYFQSASNDAQRLVGDALVRQEVFFRPTRWFRLAGGVDLRANSHGQVEDEWRLDYEDRGVLRPRAAIRRLTASISSSHLTLDAGKQFIRWGKADILNPTDRFAPRDYLNVIDSDFLPVLGVKAGLQFGPESLEVVYLPRITPSRVPLLDQRWAVLPQEAAGFTLVDRGSVFPTRAQQGVRWNHTGGRFEASASFFDGSYHLPDFDVAVDGENLRVDLTRSYSALRTYGADLALPTSVVTLKGEAAYFRSPTNTSEEYILYVVELERQTGEWLLDGGYAGEIVTRSRPGLQFGAERGIARSFIGRAAYTVDPRRSVAIEGAVRQDGAGGYVRGEYSQTMGPHWRLTVSGVGIGGDPADFLGQYHRNSHISAGLRYSF